MTNAAEALRDARRTGGVVAAKALDGVRDLEQAYAVQRAQLADGVERVVGWKIGATSAAAQAVLGLNGAVFGPVIEERVFQSGADVPLHPDQGNYLESEFTLRLKEGFPPREGPYTRPEVAERVEAIFASFELVGCRLAKGIAGAGHLVPADFGVHGACVLGGAIPRDHWDRLGPLAVTQTIDGQATMGRGDSIGWDHVFDAVAWLAGQAGRMARPLQAGDLVMTGTCTGVLPVLPGQRLQADFGGLAKVSAQLVA